jgi:hypothetical protein
MPTPWSQAAGIIWTESVRVFCLICQMDISKVDWYGHWLSHKALRRKGEASYA